MAMVVRVRFKRASKLYDFDPNGLELHTGMSVVTETARGVELGECMSGVMEVPEENVVSPLKPIIRIATEQDLLIQRRNEQYEKDAFDIALDRIAEHKLEMKLVDVEYAFDHSKIIFYFTANGRVDFRMLVKNLASIFKTRIELRQIGVRDEAKMLGGIGPCGRPICCRAFLGDFTPVSIKMAKEQNLSLNPTKISGLCDRLMCCLKYEQDQYEATRKRMPRVGREIITPDGVGTINAINVLEERVRVRIAVGDSFELREYAIDDCQRPPQDAQSAAPRPEKAEGGEKPEKGRRAERGEKPEKGERPDRKQERGEGSARRERQRPEGEERKPKREDKPPRRGGQGDRPEQPGQAQRRPEGRPRPENRIQEARRAEPDEEKAALRQEAPEAVLTPELREEDGAVPEIDVIAAEETILIEETVIEEKPDTEEKADTEEKPVTEVKPVTGEEESEETAGGGQMEAGEIEIAENGEPEDLL